MIYCFTLHSTPSGTDHSSKVEELNPSHTHIVEIEELLQFSLYRFLNSLMSILVSFVS